MLGKYLFEFKPIKYTVQTYPIPSIYAEETFQPQTKMSNKKTPSGTLGVPLSYRIPFYKIIHNFNQLFVI